MHRLNGMYMRLKMKKVFRSIGDTLKMYGVLVEHARWLSLLTVFIYALLGLMLPLSAVFMASLAEKLSENSSFSGLIVVLVFGIALIGAMQGMCTAVTSYINALIQQKIELPLRLERQRMASEFDCRWHEKREFAEMMEISAQGIEPLKVTRILKSIPSAISSIISYVGTILLLAKTQWYLPIAAAAFAFVQVVIIKSSNKYMNAAYQSGSQERIAAEVLHKEILDQASQSELRIYGKYDWAISMWKRAFLKVQNRVLSTKDRYSLYEKLSPFLQTAFSVVMMGLFIIGESAKVPETIVLVMTAYTTLQLSFSRLCLDYSAINGYSLQAANYFKLARAPISKKRAEGTNKKTVSVVLDNVSFAYDDDRDVLHGISLRISPGERIALVGENGSGKTTLAKILLQLYRPGTGTIHIADEDGEVEHCRATAVLQDYMRYQLSVRDNIAMGDIENIDDDEAIKAAYRAVCGDELSLALDDILGKQFGSRDLSGGEWQRLAIARAYFREAPLIVLDEPNASIDAFAEAAMIKRMFDMAKDKTCVFITHRLTTTALADRIIVMQDGSICEEGSHEELMRRNGEYARMYNVQAGMYA